MSEREKDERLIARKIEEEQMMRQLTDIGIYEPEYSYKEMKELLEFVNGSQNTSNAASNNKDTHKGQHADNQRLAENASDTNASQEMALQECADTRISYSYRLNSKSTTAHESKTSPYANRSESPPIFEVQNSSYGHKNSGSEMFEKHESTNSIHSTNRLLSLRSSSTNNPRECQNVTERKTDTEDEFCDRLKRWRLNPLDAVIDENDVPLKQPNRPRLLKKRAPFEYCRETDTIEQRDQAIQHMGQHLKEVADLWHSWQPANPNFQWGSPIQVGTANGSLDKKPITESKTEPIKTECTYRDSHERASKRKASSIIANLSKENAEDEDDEGWFDYSHGKKKRGQCSDVKSRDGNVQRERAIVNQHTHNNTRERATSSNAINDYNDNDSDTDFGNERVKSLRSKRIDDKTESASIDLNTYPRRIVPPNPKGRLSLARLRKGTGTTSKSSPKTRRINENKIADKQLEKQENLLTDREIQEVLDDWNTDEEGETAVKKNAEVRPLPLSKDVRSRLLEKRLSLRNTETVKETRMTVKNGDESDEERKEEKRPKLCEQRKREEKLCRTKNGNRNWEHIMSDDDDDEDKSETNRESDAQNGNQSDVVITTTFNVRCPICNKLFSHGEIENHAAFCEQFDTNNEEVDINKTIKLECSICSNYETNNGVEYEEHVEQCSNRRDKRHSRGSQDIDIASASSFHTKKRIVDEQKDCEIAFLGQFPSKKEKVDTNKKRKLYTKKNDACL